MQRRYAFAHGGEGREEIGCGICSVLVRHYSKTLRPKQLSTTCIIEKLYATGACAEMCVLQVLFSDVTYVFGKDEPLKVSH